MVPGGLLYITYLATYFLQIAISFNKVGRTAGAMSSVGGRDWVVCGGSPLIIKGVRTKKSLGLRTAWTF